MNRWTRYCFLYKPSPIFDVWVNWFFSINQFTNNSFMKKSVKLISKHVGTLLIMWCVHKKWCPHAKGSFSMFLFMILRDFMRFLKLRGIRIMHTVFGKLGTSSNLFSVSTISVLFICLHSSSAVSSLAKQDACSHGNCRNRIYTSAANFPGGPTPSCSKWGSTRK